MHNIQFTTLDLRKILGVALAFQVAFLVVLGLDEIGLTIPALRQVLTFSYLTLVPGIVILELLKADFSRLNTYLYAISISIVFLIFTGFLTNLIYPPLGIREPLSLIPLVITITIIVVFCAILAMNKNKQSFFPPSLRLLQPCFLFLLLLLLLTALGSILIRDYENNLLLIASLIIIGLTPAFIVFNKIPKEFYPLATFVVFLSLLYHNSLSIPYFSGRDIQIEYYYSNLVNLNSRWLPAFSESQSNSLLSDVILSTIYSKISGVSLTWVIKLLYPFLFAVGLVTLYQAFKSQVDEKWAFLSCFFIASLGVNYEEVLATMKHPMTLFFISFLALLIVDGNIAGIRKAFLALAFLFGLVVSHYGVPYIFLFSSLFVLILLSFGKKLKRFEVGNSLTTPSFVMLLAGLVVSWFFYTSGSAGFLVIVRLVRNIISSLAELFSPIERGGVYYLTTELPSWEWEILRLLHIIAQFFILLGFLTVLYQKLTKKREHMHNEFFLYSAAFLGWLGASIIIPVVVGGSSLGMPRMYSLSIIFLAPYTVIGGVEIITGMKKLLLKFKGKVQEIKIQEIESKALIVLAVFLMIFLLFNTRLVMEINQEVFGENGYVKSLSISQPRIMHGEGSLEEIAGFFRDYNSHLDVQGAKWLEEYRSEEKKIAIDYSSLVLVYAMVPLHDVIDCLDLHSCLKHIESKQVYLYLRESNVKYGGMSGRRGEYWRTAEILPSLESLRNKIYSNGGSLVYD